MKTRLVLAALALAGAASVAHADNNPFSGARSIEVTMTRDEPVEKRALQQKRSFDANSQHSETCEASQYGVGDRYHGRRTASGSIFNTYATSPYTVAHRTRPFGSFVTVTNLKNGKSIRAVVTDRGPFVAGRCVDLGRAGANALGMGGTAQVSVQ